MITIPVSRGVTAFVDDIDADLAQFTWSYSTDGYPGRSVPGRRGKHEFMHRVVLARKLGREIAPKMVAHHVNGNVLDNRRDNLQEMTHAENMGRRRYGKNRIIPQASPARRVRSGVVGVYPASRGGWVGQVYYKGKVYTTRTYATVEEAREAYEQMRQSLEEGTHKPRKLSAEEKQRRETEKQAHKEEVKRRRREQSRRHSFQRYSEELKEYVTVLPLTQGQETIIDAVDADLDEYCWVVNGHGYVTRREYKGQSYLLHRVILERKVGRPLEAGIQTDHINRNRLDNRRANLREATSAQNNRNHSMRVDNTSGYVGISQNKQREGWWNVVIKKNKYVGSYATLEEAKVAYDQAALREYGEFYYNSTAK